jgi:RES domain
MMALKFDPTPFLMPVSLNEEFVRISNASFPVNSVNLRESGRFHGPGQNTYYFASGLFTAKTELWDSPDVSIPSTHQVHGVSPGPYLMFDMTKLLTNYPDLESEYFPSGEQGGWTSCQELRTELSSFGCSGVLYPSHKQEDGINSAVWPLDNKPLPSDMFTRYNIL